MIIDMIIVPQNDVKALSGKQLNAVPSMYLADRIGLKHYSLWLYDLDKNVPVDPDFAKLINLDRGQREESDAQVAREGEFSLTGKTRRFTKMAA